MLFVKMVDSNAKYVSQFFSGHVGIFKWSEYLADPHINPAPAHLFTEVQ